MKRLVACVILIFSLSALAASPTAELERLVDRYQYALNVEWDQNDQSFKQDKTQEFFRGISDLISRQGLQVEDILAVTQKRVTDPEQLNTLRLQLASLSNAKDTSEIARLLSEKSADFYVRGASWSSNATITTGFGLFAAAMIGYEIWFNANYKCEGYVTEYTCYHHPRMGSSCGDHQVCTGYVKK